MSDNQIILTQLSETGVFRLILNRPDKRNALSLEMLDAISDALTQAEASEARVIVISANGPVFSSGHDLRELTTARANKDDGRDFFVMTMQKCAQMMQQIVNHPLPVIAQIQGPASAAGCQLVASCDLAVASTAANFATPGVNIGLFCSTPMVALSRNVANKHTMEMLLTGEVCSAEHATQIGLINKAVPHAELENSVAELTGKIVAKSKRTLKIGKQAYYKQSELPLAEAYEYCASVMVENMLINDAKEGIGAFLEKREPTWSDS